MRPTCRAVIGQGSLMRASRMKSDCGLFAGVWLVWRSPWRRRGAPDYALFYYRLALILGSINIAANTSFHLDVDVQRKLHGPWRMRRFESCPNVDVGHGRFDYRQSAVFLINGGRNSSIINLYQDKQAYTTGCGPPNLWGFLPEAIRSPHGRPSRSTVSAIRKARHGPCTVKLWGRVQPTQPSGTLLIGVSWAGPVIRVPTPIRRFGFVARP